MKDKEKLTYCGLSDMGRQRTNNEDAFVAEQLDENAILAVAIDGVGGYEGGEVAAEIAQTEIPKYLHEFQNGERIELLKQAVISANNAIYDRRQLDTARSNMSCVLTSAIVDKGRKVVDMVHVGDTRIYQYRHGGLRKLSHDHSLIGYREEVGDLTEEQAMHHPQRNVISRDVGSAKHEVEDRDFLEAEEFPLLPNSVFLLCSDGLTDLITSKQIVEILEQTITLDEKTQKLIDAANEAGGKDNITVVLVEYQAEENAEQVIEQIVEPLSAEAFNVSASDTSGNMFVTPKKSRWCCFWQKRRKILAIAVLISTLLSVLLLLFCKVIPDSAVIQLENIVYNVTMALCCFGCMCSLWLIVYELKFILKKQKNNFKFRIITSTHFLLMALLLSSVLVGLFRNFSDDMLFWGISVIVSFVIEVCLCCYEFTIYCIKPIKQLKQICNIWNQRGKVYLRAVFYAVAYVISILVCYVVGIIVGIIISASNYAQYEDCGDVVYNRGPGGAGDFITACLIWIIPIVLILSTFSMNIFNNEIEKRIEDESQ